MASAQPPGSDQPLGDASGGIPIDQEFLVSWAGIQYRVKVHCVDQEINIPDVRSQIQGVLQKLGDEAKSVRSLELSLSKSEMTRFDSTKSALRERVEEAALSALLQQPFVSMQLSPLRAEVCSSWLSDLGEQEQAAHLPGALGGFDGLKRSYRNALVGVLDECKAVGSALSLFRACGSIEDLGLYARTIQINQKYLFSPRALGYGHNTNAGNCYVACLGNLAQHVSHMSIIRAYYSSEKYDPKYLDRGYLSCVLACISAGPDRSVFEGAAVDAGLHLVGGNIRIIVKGHDCLINIEHIAMRHMIAYFNYSEKGSPNAAFTTFWPLMWDMNDLKNCLRAAIAELLVDSAAGGKFTAAARPGENVVEFNLPGQGPFRCSVVLGALNQEPIQILTCYPREGPYLLAATKAVTDAIADGYLAAAQVEGRPQFD